MTKVLAAFPDEHKAMEVEECIQRIDTLLKSTLVQLVPPEVTSKVSSMKSLLLQVWHGGVPVLESNAEGVTARLYARIKFFVRSLDTSTNTWKFGSEAMALLMMELPTVTTPEELSLYTTWGWLATPQDRKHIAEMKK